MLRRKQRLIAKSRFWRFFRKNPYIKHQKQPVTMLLDRDTVAYFKSMAEETGIPYQTLINLYLWDCAVHHRKLQMKWAP